MSIVLIDLEEELKLTKQGTNSADDKQYFFVIFLENRIWHFMQMISLETICMKCQILFCRKNKKDISNCRVLIFFPQHERAYYAV